MLACMVTPLDLQLEVPGCGSGTGAVIAGLLSLWGNCGVCTAVSVQGFVACCTVSAAPANAVSLAGVDEVSQGRSHRSGWSGFNRTTFVRESYSNVLLCCDDSVSTGPLF